MTYAIVDTSSGHITACRDPTEFYRFRSPTCSFFKSSCFSCISSSNIFKYLCTHCRSACKSIHTKLDRRSNKNPLKIPIRDSIRVELILKLNHFMSSVTNEQNLSNHKRKLSWRQDLQSILNEHDDYLRCDESDPELEEKKQLIIELLSYTTICYFALFFSSSSFIRANL